MHCADRNGGKVSIELPPEMTEEELVRIFFNTPYRLMYYKEGVLKLVPRESYPLRGVK